MLDEYGIPYVRIDGKTSLSKRAEALRLFHGKDNIRVILVSVTCGGAGSVLPLSQLIHQC
jgi:SWI/SNF-related matrix-associated actin-dependent regulator of chromatin subfamily A3